MVMLDILPEIFYYLNFIVILFFVIFILLSNQESESSLGWILLVMVFPVVGIGLYMLVGVDRKKHKVIARRPEDLFSERLEPVLQDQKRFIMGSDPGDSETMTDILKNIKLLLTCNQAALTMNNEAKLYHNGESLFNDMLQDLSVAEESIHMEYYIWRSDELGEKIKEILVRKARQGVDVKLIFDGLGSFGRISYRYRRELREAGVQFSYFKDLNRFLARLQINYSNHKKIVVIDSRVGYTGGMNIGSEYITGGKQFDSWRDSHVRLRGNSVSILQSIFLTDWFNCGHKLLMDDDFFPDIRTELHPSHEIPIQIAVSGPDSKWNSIELLLFNMITNANHEVCIQSPYFIPDLAMMRALESAAMSGIKITLMMTGHPDKSIIWWTAFTYMEPLLEAGVEILHYEKGFLHSKVLIMDTVVSTVGTCNMDVRSFRLNYEVNTVLYDDQIARELKEQFVKDREFCRTITLEEIKSMSLPFRLRNSFCRLFSPLM